MFAGISFRSRLLLAFCLVIALSLLIPSWYARRIFSENIVEDATSGAVRELSLARLLAAEKGSFDGLDELQAWMSDLGSRLDVRLTFIADDGVVLADSHVAKAQLPTLANHALRPEIIEARVREFGYNIRLSDSIGDRLIYAAGRVEGVKGLPKGFLRLAAPYSDVETRLARLEKSFMAVMGLALAVAALISFVLARSFSRSIRDMIEAVKAIGGGDYDRRLRVLPGLEFQGLAEAVNAMAGGIGRHIETITGQKSQLEAMLNSMREGVLVLDGDGRIVKSNPALKRILAGSGDFKGRRPLEVVSSPELQHACDSVLGDAGGDGPPASIFLQIEPRPGSVYDVSITRLRGGGGLGALAVFHDISELKRLERVRSDFVANVSHELRTPLTTVKGYAETLLDNPGAAPEQTERFLETIRRNADHMARMVEDLLGLSRLEAETEGIKPGPVDAADALSGAFKACASLAGDRNVALESELPESGIMVRAEFNRLVQVFRNLVENAVRYSPESSSVVVSAEVVEGEVVFSVVDRGPGIPREDQTRIFERFYRVEKHRRKTGGGSTGLGLAICKHIIDRLNGRIWVDSPASDGIGAAFRFTLPALPPDA